ncbi:hypothetical protein Barb6XT_02913 [Bacteroidales bacterium Barb6XT]|nr:hypothetical protein Barb6XT_03148 [Bacteroidales bacterium Barb6XT]OAV64151.1 hypothetical protein Barb6XT_02913 [Bacteroidales bacterium Barb6XT]
MKQKIAHAFDFPANRYLVQGRKNKRNVVNTVRFHGQMTYLNRVEKQQGSVKLIADALIHYFIRQRYLIPLSYKLVLP